MAKVEVTEEEFKRFVTVQKSGEVNMFDRRAAAELADIGEDVYAVIMKRYSEFAEQWPDAQEGE